MEAIDDLYRCGGSLANAVRVEWTSIPTDGRNRRMPGKPDRDGCGGGREPQASREPGAGLPAKRHADGTQDGNQSRGVAGRGATSSGRRSVKMRRAQVGRRHTNFRTISWICTARAPQGRSVSWRW